MTDIATLDVPEEMLITDECIAQAERWETLGPAYFASRAVAERFMASFEAEHFKPLIEKFKDEFRDRMWSDITDFFVSDTENNLHSTIYRQVDEIVSSILGGNRWATKKYVLGDGREHQDVREAVARLIPVEIQDARIADLEAKLAAAEKEIEFLRRMR